MLNNDYLSKLCSDKIPVSVDALNSANSARWRIYILTLLLRRNNSEKMFGVYGTV